MERVRTRMGWLRHHPEVALAPLAVVALAGMGFDLSVDLWRFGALALITGTVVAGAQRRWPGDQQGFGLHARVGLAAGSMMVLAYSTGWGAALSLIFVLVIADNVRLSGSRAARVAFDWSLVAIALGQLGIQLHVLPSFIAVPAVHGVAVIGALALAVVSQRIHLMTARKERAEAEVSASERRFRSLVSQSSDVIVVIDPEARIVYQSPSSTEVLGYDDQELVGRSYLELIHPDDVESVLDTVRMMLEDPSSPQLVECRLRREDGDWIEVESNCQNRLEDAQIGGFVVNTRDVSERKSLEAQLHHRAFFDGLTGLANRHLFRDRVDQAVARSRRHRDPFAVLFLDLDGFKDVNDTLGHQAGDQLLCHVGERIRHAIREHDTAARLGGDEFAVLVEDMTDVSDAARVAERILAGLRLPVDLDGTPVQVDGSIGIAITRPGEDGSDPHLRDGTDAVLRNADIAMYMAKSAGKARYEIFEPSMHVAVIERLELEADLQHALDEGQFVLHYQPIVTLTGSRIVGVEALLRWQHPERGLVSPAEFVPTAEETGMIVPIGGWVLREACKQVKRWSDALPDREPLHVSVNVSSRQLSRGDLVKDVRIALAVSGLPPEQLTLEVTESALVPDVTRALSIFRELKSLGVGLAVDDFGTGYSSLSYLQDFPFDVLKIDRSFISGVSNGSQSPALVRAIIDLGRSLKLRTVAEGIEHDDQLARFRDLHCDYGQGFLFARPGPSADVEALLRGESDVPLRSLVHAAAETEPRPRPA